MAATAAVAGTLLTLVTLVTSVAAGAWTNDAVLDADGMVRIKWRVHDGNFTCQLEVDTLGWVAFGLSPNGAMKNSDMVVAGVDHSSGLPYLTDMNSRDGYRLTVDKRQDYHLVSAWEDDTTTTVVFTRRLISSCRPGDISDEDRDITADTQHVLYAYHSRDPAVVSEPPQHEHRGRRSLHLTDPAEPTPPSDDDAHQLTTWSVRQSAVRLPAEDTVYWCDVIRAPQLTTKHHAIKYRAVITPGNERVVHHMLLYQCSDRDFSDLGTPGAVPNGGFRCYSANMPPAARGCRGIIAGWGIGGEDFTFPEDVGYPIGPDHGAEFYILEIHYDLAGRSGVVDSSGLEFTLTSTPRPMDSSMMTLGHDISQLLVVPPRLPTLVVTGHCSDECLDLALPPEGVTVFAALPHTHLLGHQVRLRHFRRGVELPPIVRDDNYDFNYQQLRHVTPRKLLPGDQLTAECVYRSSQRANVTLGGQSTWDEMCIVFIQYYPAIKLAQCVSTPLPRDLLSSLGVWQTSTSRYKQLVVQQPLAWRGVLFEEYLNQLDWTPDRVDNLQRVARDGVHLPECYQFGRHVLSTTRNTTQYPAGAKKLGWLRRASACEDDKAASSATYASCLLTVAALCWSALLG
ncbi:DBH-like monooxygenase protein 1 [Pollicipes pollicipes]|uniref:DBH-like monooxygenase protein 1 n=1 Tax=Pollicipes pollicipes TaxID=41117 RepID=UPI001884C5CE|nr:DBH-like monooxygenase protein 1 [Pollicipes pollicipes]